MSIFRSLSLTLLAAGLVASEPAIVSGISVVSDKVADVSSIEAWQRSYIKDGMTDADKALAVFTSIVGHGHHDPGPNGFAGLDAPNARDAIELFNVYGYGSDVTTTSALQLWRHLGFQARGWTANRWGCVPEVEYGGAWHAYDPTMICYFRKPDKSVASVEELSAGVKRWYDENPGFKGDLDKVRAFMKEKGIAAGPEILRDGPTMAANGSFTYYYFGWYTAMLLYDGENKTPFRYEENYDQGYRVNNQLHRGERLTMRWSNTGKHVNMDGVGGAPEVLGATVGEQGKPLYYTPAFGDIANGRVGNGRSEWTVPLDAGLTDAAITADNIALTGGKLLAKDASKPANLILRRTCSYVFLGGSLDLDAAVDTGGRIAVAYSDDHGRSWKDLGAATTSGPATIAIPSIRRYDYRLRLTMTGKGTEVRSLMIGDDIQHSQRPLPALGQGENKIAFQAAHDEGTITIRPCGPGGAAQGVSPDEYGFTTVGVNPLDGYGPYVANAAEPTITIPVETPGDLVRLRFGCTFRTGGPGDAWHYEVSYDEGKTWKEAAVTPGNQRFGGTWTTVDKIPAGTRRALVRYRGTSQGNLILWRLRVDADYREPKGAYAPIKVTYLWTENGAEKKDEHVAKQAKDAWTIACSAKPTMKELVLERAPGK